MEPPSEREELVVIGIGLVLAGIAATAVWIAIVMPFVDVFALALALSD